MITILPTVAPSLLAVGQHGPFVTPSAVLLTPNGYVFTFTNGADWPLDGSHVMDVTLEHFVLGKWMPIAFSDYVGAPWKDRAGNVVNTSTWHVGGTSVPDAELLRMWINVLQPVTLGWEAHSL